MRELIKVTTNCIKDGIPKSGTCCPIALAIDEAFPNKYLCENVLYKTAEFKQGIRVDLPRSAQRFIKRFDADKSVKPFNFYLDF